MLLFLFRNAKLTKAPMAPASIGVKNPTKSPPMTSRNNRRVSTSPEKEVIFFLNPVFGLFGARSSLMRIHI